MPGCEKYFSDEIQNFILHSYFFIGFIELTELIGFIPPSAFHLLPDMLQTDLQQPRHMFIIQGIINNLAVTAAFNQSQVF